MSSRKTADTRPNDLVHNWSCSEARVGTEYSLQCDAVTGTQSVIGLCVRGKLSCIEIMLNLNPGRLPLVMGWLSQLIFNRLLNLNPEWLPLVVGWLSQLVFNEGCKLCYAHRSNAVAGMHGRNSGLVGNPRSGVGWRPWQHRRRKYDGVGKQPR